MDSYARKKIDSETHNINDDRPLKYLFTYKLPTLPNLKLMCLLCGPNECVSAVTE